MLFRSRGGGRCRGLITSSGQEAPPAGRPTPPHMPASGPCRDGPGERRCYVLSMQLRTGALEQLVFFATYPANPNDVQASLLWSATCVVKENRHQLRLLGPVFSILDSSMRPWMPRGQGGGGDLEQIETTRRRRRPGTYRFERPCTQPSIKPICSSLAGPIVQYVVVGPKLFTDRWRCPCRPGGFVL